jgi:hypothetical protein
MADVIGVFFDEELRALGPKHSLEAARRLSLLVEMCCGCPASGQATGQSIFSRERNL